jgi:hypothetical protein
LEPTTQFEIGKSILKTILGDSDEAEDDEERAHNEIKSIAIGKHINIPDTCVDIFNYPTKTDSNNPKNIRAAPIQKKSYIMGFAEHENKNDTVETNEDMNETRLDNTIVKNNYENKNLNTLHSSRVVSRTPSTCSPQTAQETQLPVFKEKPVANKKLDLNSSAKYMEQQFSPLVQSPQKVVVLGLSTPTKGVLKTPSKASMQSQEDACRSPSIIAKKSKVSKSSIGSRDIESDISKKSEEYIRRSPSIIAKKATSTALETNENDAENELDCSFDFREQKNDTQNKKLSNSSFKPKNTLENISNKPQIKRFKQLTMALSNHADSRSKSSQNANKISKTSLATGKSFSSNQLDIHIDEDFSDEMQDVRNQNLRSAFSIKNEPVIYFFYRLN